MILIDISGIKEGPSRKIHSIFLRPISVARMFTTVYASERRVYGGRAMRAMGWRKGA
jgi:hypothetical protein